MNAETIFFALFVIQFVGFVRNITINSYYEIVYLIRNKGVVILELDVEQRDYG